jgi:hypothetical protein
MEKMEHKLVAWIIQTLDGRLPKRNIVTKETRENKFSIHVEQPPNNNHFHVDSTLIVNFIMDGFLRVSTFPRLN